MRPQKTRGPKKSTPNVFFLFPVLVFQRGAPKSPRSPENVIGPQNLKMEDPKVRSPKRFFFSLFQRGIQTARGPKESKAPKVQGREAPKFKKSEAPKAGPQTQHFLFLLWARGSKKRSQGQKFIGFRKFQNLQQTVTY